MSFPIRRSIAALSLIAAVSAVVLTSAGCSGAEARKARYLERGQAYIAEENYEKARVELRNVLQIDPGNAEARFLSGRVAEKLQELREAVGFYNAAIEANPDHVQARASLARLYMLGGASDKALKLIEPALQKAEDADLLAIRGAVRARQGDTQGAFDDAQRAVKISPDNENAIALLASIYTKTGKADAALALLKDAVQRHPRSSDLRFVLSSLYLQRGDRPGAENELKQLIALKPQDLGLRRQLTMFYLGGKDVAAAERTLREAVAAVPQSVEPKLALVDFLATQRSREAAEREYLAFVEREPKNAQLRLGLGQFYERAGQADKAEAVYREVIAGEQRSAQGLTARNRVAALEAQSGEYDEAGRLIEEVLKENPHDNDALILRGNIALSRGDPATAIADLRAVLRDQPGSVGLLRALARAHLQNNEPALAEESLRRAMEAAPKDLDPRIDLAQLLMQQGRTAQSVELLEQVVRDAPQNVAARELLFRGQLLAQQWDGAARTAEDIKLLKPDQALGHYLAGLVSEARKKPEQGIAEFERALELQPGATEPLTALVRAKLAQKQTDAALTLLDKQIERVPNNVIARNLKGEVLLEKKSYPEAVQTLQGAIERAPKWWVPYRNLAAAQLAQKNVPGAIDAYRRGLQATQDSAPLALALAALYENTGKAEEAIQVYEGLVKREPHSDIAANNLAMLLATYRKDRASLDRAHDLAARFATSTVPAYLDTHGWVQYRRGEFDAALPALQQAVDKVPDSPLLRYHLGMAQFRAGRLDQARENLRLALAPGKGFTGLDEARATFEQISKNNSG